MHFQTFLGLVTGVTGLLAAVPASAADPAASKQGARNDRVCEDITLTGSRLATKRFCGTRAEWEDRKRQDREAVEAAQRGPCVLQSTGMRGRPSC